MTPSDPYEFEVEPIRGKKPSGGDDAGGPPPSVEDGTDLFLAFQPLNDYGNANRLKTRFGEDLIYIDNNGWFAWDGIRWDREGSSASAIKLAHRVALGIRDEAAALKAKRPDLTERVGRLCGWSLQSGNQAKAHAMLDAAKAYLVKPLDVLDADPLMVACTNGTILLRSHVGVRPSERGDYVTRRLGVPFVEAADCPMWHRFLDRVMPDHELQEFLQRIGGYVLTGSTREQCVVIFYGTGRNGKSTFVNVLRHIMGDYAMNSPVQTFLAKSAGGGGGEASPDIARLPGVRLLTASEPPEGARLDEGMIKAMTSNEIVTARHLNQGFFEFRPKFKLMISTNHYPRIRGTDIGIWRRIRLVPWTVRIPEEEVDPDLERKLIAEASGILQWMLTGAEEWLAGGLAPPEKAKAAVEDYRAAQDPVGEFLAAKCEVCPESINPATQRPFETTAKDLRAAYKSWCDEEGLEPMNGNIFVERLMGKGISKRTLHGRVVYVGVHINTQAIEERRGW